MEVRMSKRIVICANGTCNRSEKDPRKNYPTNVQRITQAIRYALGFYQRGITDERNDTAV